MKIGGEEKQKVILKFKNIFMAVGELVFHHGVISARVAPPILIVSLWSVKIIFFNYAGGAVQQRPGAEHDRRHVHRKGYGTY